MAALPEPWKSLRTKIEALAERIRKLENRSPFFGTGMHANGNGGIDSDNFVAGTSGYSFKADGNAEFNDLTLRGGIIGNDALANPLDADINGANGAGLSVSTTSTVMATTSLTVPAGFTRALVRADALGEAANSTASDDYLYVDANIQGISGGESYAYTPSGKANSAVGIANRFVTGLSGGDVITCTAMSRTAFAGWAADGVNLWVIHMQVIWLR